VLIHRVEPSRPPGSLTGTVVLIATIGVEGKPSGIKPISGHPVLVAAATAAFRQWRYEPARRNGNPVAAPVEVRFVFSLR
jgi:protein TonB